MDQNETRGRVQIELPWQFIHIHLRREGQAVPFSAGLQVYKEGVGKRILQCVVYDRVKGNLSFGYLDFEQTDRRLAYGHLHVI